MPAAPHGWASSTEHLIRIIDPLGQAIAWVAPGRRDAVVGFSVRMERPGEDSSLSRWKDVIVAPTAPAHTPESQSKGDDNPAYWTLVERDPTACALESRVAQPGTVETRRFSALVSDARLTLVLDMEGHDGSASLSHFHLNLRLSSLPTITVGLHELVKAGEPEKVNRGTAKDRTQIVVMAHGCACVTQLHRSIHGTSHHVTLRCSRDDEHSFQAGGPARICAELCLANQQRS